MRCDQLEWPLAFQLQGGMLMEASCLVGVLDVQGVCPQEWICLSLKNDDDVPR
jgi:hypothetical protein